MEDYQIDTNSVEIDLQSQMTAIKNAEIIVPGQLLRLVSLDLYQNYFSVHKDVSISLVLHHYDHLSTS